MKKLLLAIALLLELGASVPTPAAAACSVNIVPGVGLICDIQKLRTYSAAAVGLVPAASATDILCLNGSASAAISLREIIISGSAGTAITTPVLLYRRVSLDTGGTAATGLALPVGVANISTDSAPTATLTAYTANPTVVDSSPSLLVAPAVSFSVTTGTNSATFIPAGSQVDFFSKGYDIPKGSTTQQLCLNLNGVTVTTGVLAISLQWIEN